MRALTRLPLAANIAEWLEARTADVAAAEDKRAEVERLWTGSGAMYEGLRSRLIEMASGRRRCMYCEDGIGTDIDHFFPKLAYPDQAFVWFNHLLACAGCNRRKSNIFPLDDAGDPILIDPTTVDPAAHLVFSPHSGDFVPLTRSGERSIEVYGLNRQELVQGRRDTWVNGQRLIVAYAEELRAGRPASAENVVGVVVRHGFSAVLLALMTIADSPLADLLVAPECLAAIRAFPEIRFWAI